MIALPPLFLKAGPFDQSSGPANTGDVNARFRFPAFRVADHQRFSQHRETYYADITAQMAVALDLEGTLGSKCPPPDHVSEGFHQNDTWDCAVSIGVSSWCLHSFGQITFTSALIRKSSAHVAGLRSNAVPSGVSRQASPSCCSPGPATEQGLVKASSDSHEAS
ncbi:hypothetical protein CB1_000273003 [Camelus ferus]|nr:hypothetical protein CB1_000273003 [Camelus ferus]